MRGMVGAAALALAIWLPAAGVRGATPVNPEIMLQAGHDCLVGSAAWSPDSRFVVTVAQDCALDDRQAIVWEAATGRVFDRFMLKEARGAELSINPDGRFLVVRLP